MSFHTMLLTFERLPGGGGIAYVYAPGRGPGKHGIRVARSEIVGDPSAERVVDRDGEGHGEIVGVEILSPGKTTIEDVVKDLGL